MIVLVVMVLVVAVLIVMVLVVAVLVMLPFVVIVLWEGHVVASVVAVEFVSVFGVLSENVDVSRGWVSQRRAEVLDQHRLVVKGGLSRGHGVCFNGNGAVAVHVGKGAFDPWLQAKAVIKEHISLAESNQVRSGWFVVVDGDVHGAHHLNGHQIAANRRSELFDVVR